MDIKITYRNGIPTQKSIKELADRYFSERVGYKIKPTAYYGTLDYRKEITSNLLWQSDEIQSNIYGFIDFLADFGIEVFEVRDYKTPLVGSLQIKQKAPPTKHRIY